MRTSLVFCYYTYDGDGRPAHNQRAATLAAIERLNGVPMRETGIEVHEGEIDADGFLIGPPSCGDPVHRQ